MSGETLLRPHSLKVKKSGLDLGVNLLHPQTFHQEGGLLQHLHKRTWPSSLRPLVTLVPSLHHQPQCLENLNRPVLFWEHN